MPRVTVTVADSQGNETSAQQDFDVEQPFDQVWSGTVPGGFTVPSNEVHRIEGLVETDANVVVEGTLVERAGDFLKFTGINEEAFGVGGGTVVVPSDIGLWVMDNGRLDIQGTPKLGWSRVTAGVAQGATLFELQDDPFGWQVGDEIAIAPSEPPTVANHWTHDEVRTITAISGRTITVNMGFTYPHPATVIPDIDGNPVTYTTEVENLTRDCGVLGEVGKKSHVFIHTMMHPHTIKYALFRYLGPRKAAAQGFSDVIPGRWPLHLHHAGQSSFGTIVEGVVVRDCGSHAYVAHDSAAVFRDCVAHNNMEGSYWWDEPPEFSDGVVYDRCGLIRETSNQKNNRGQLAGFSMSRGDFNVTRDCFATGVQGAPQTGDPSGIFWLNSEGQPPRNSVWEASGFVAHNNSKIGVRWWRNDGQFHRVTGFVSYNHRRDVTHGAYGNLVMYEDCIFGPSTEYSAEQHAATGTGLAEFANEKGGFTRCVFTDGITLEAPPAGQFVIPTLWLDCRMDGFIHLATAAPFAGTPPTRAYDYVRMTHMDGERDLTPADFILNFPVREGVIVRVQLHDYTAYQINDQGNVSTIPAFHP